MKKLPAHLPPLPYAAVYLGRGGEFSVPEDGVFVGWRASDAVPIWDVSRTRGLSPNVHYAALTDKSEIARLNGCGKPSWDSAPEWANWRAQGSGGEWGWFDHKPYAHRSGCWQGAENSEWHNTHYEGPPNPNWRDTLERRPTKTSKLEFEIDSSAVRDAAGKAFKEIKESGGLPDLIIPADIAKHADIHSLVAMNRDGYRIEWDSNGIRGWKE